MYTGKDANGNHVFSHASNERRGIRYKNPNDTLESEYYSKRFAGFGSIRKMMGKAEIGQLLDGIGQQSNQM